MDLTVIAIPGYFSSMGAEYRHLKKLAATSGPTAATYERRDTIASLTMGTASLFAPLVFDKLLKPVTPGRGRWAKVLVGAAVGAAAITTVADILSRRPQQAGVVDLDTDPVAEERASRLGAIASSSSVVAVSAGVTAAACTWAARTTGRRLYERRVLPDLGTGALAVGAAIVGWDFIYYWNHRLSHESRFLWAIHVIHHSSEHYNLSTALRQPVGDAFGLFVPYGALALLGIRPEVIETARGVNLIYQYWVHTDVIKSIGPAEAVFNSPSHHRVHHGSNKQYLDRNHAGIWIIWDKLFGTFEPEVEPVVYGLTKNIDTFNPLVIATHEHADILRDVAQATTWRDRLSYVFRGPGWAYSHNGREAYRAEAQIDIEAA